MQPYATFTLNNLINLDVLKGLSIYFLSSQTAVAEYLT